MCAGSGGSRPAPEFEMWLQRMGLMDSAGRMLPDARRNASRLLSFAGGAWAIPSLICGDDHRRASGSGSRSDLLPTSRVLEDQMAHALPRCDPCAARCGGAVRSLQICNRSSWKAAPPVALHLERPDEGLSGASRGRRLLLGATIARWSSATGFPRAPCRSMGLRWREGSLSPRRRDGAGAHLQMRRWRGWRSATRSRRASAPILWSC